MRAVRVGTLVLAVGIASLATACASAREGTDQGTSNTLTRDQIMGVQGARNLYDVVQRLRPRWLNVRAENRSLGGGQAEILVYQDQSRLGNVEMLRQLDPTLPVELRYLDAATAVGTLPGIGAATHVAGAIIVVTRGRN